MNRSRSWSRSHKKESARDGPTLMKTKSSGAGDTLMKRRAPEPGAVSFLRLRSPEIIDAVAGRINNPD